MKPEGIIFAITILIIVTAPLHGQDDSMSQYNTFSYTIPGPEPFTIDDSSAIYCINLLRSTPFIEVKDETGNTGIVKVKTVWSYFLGVDESYPKGHQLRYDIIINGEPLDWNNSFIEYGGDMINLRLLFLYRNQHPPGNLEYLNNP